LLDNLRFIVRGNEISGDFNLDGAIDGADLTVWKASFAGGTSGGTVADVDGDGDADGADFLTWQRTLGPPSTSALSSVPEPTAAALAAAIGVLGLLSHRLRRRRRLPLA
jgi:hypothetical protein